MIETDSNLRSTDWEISFLLMSGVFDELDFDLLRFNGGLSSMQIVRDSSDVAGALIKLNEVHEGNFERMFLSLGEVLAS